MRADHAFLDDDIEEAEADDAAATFLTFDLDGQTLGVAVKRVREILDLHPLTRLPNAPDEVRGVLDVRGASVPVLDMGARLGMGASKTGPETRIVVFDFEQDGATRVVGVLADRVRDVRRIEAEAIEAAPLAGISGLSSGLIQGLSRQDGALVVLIDVERAFSDGIL